MVKRVSKKVSTSTSSSSDTSSPASLTTNTEGGSADLRVLSQLVERLQLANMAGLQYGGLRDLYAVFGYNKNPTPDHFISKYVRQDIASRIIDAPPDATWTNPPAIEAEASIQSAWDKIVKEAVLWGAIHRADRLARLNPFSLILFGFNDGNLEKPVKKASELLYVRAMGSRQVTELTYNSNPKSPQYGKPETYKICYDDPTKKISSRGGVNVIKQKDITVHASRVVHIVESPLEDTTFGTPIIEKVFNLLDDLLKVTGGTAETYWLTGNRGMQADIDKEMDIDPADAAALTAEIQEYMHQLSRIIRTRGVKLNVLDTNTPNPKEIFEMIMALISGTTGIPRRILLGSEAGQLASEQDRANWAERIQEQRSLFAAPSILDPSVKLLQGVGLVPEGDFTWNWPSAFVQNPLEEGQTMAQTARAIGNISRQTGGSTPMQLISRKEAREILGYDDDLSESDIYEPPAYQTAGKAPDPNAADGGTGDIIGKPGSQHVSDVTGNSEHLMTREDIEDIVVEMQDRRARRSS